MTPTSFSADDIGTSVMHTTYSTQTMSCTYEPGVMKIVGVLRIHHPRVRRGADEIITPADLIEHGFLLMRSLPLQV